MGSLWLLFYPRNLTSSPKSFQSCISTNLKVFVIKELLHDLSDRQEVQGEQIVSQHINSPEYNWLRELILMWQGIFSKELSSMQSLCPVMCIVHCLFIWKPSLWRGLLNNNQVLITWRIIRRSHLDLGKLWDRKKWIQRSFRAVVVNWEWYCLLPIPTSPPTHPPIATTQCLYPLETLSNIWNHFLFSWLGVGMVLLASRR